MSKAMKSRPLRGTLCGLGLVTAIFATGCQMDVNGQTLPSPYYLQDDIQYFAPGPKMKHAREAAGLKAARDEEQANLIGQ